MRGTTRVIVNTKDEAKGWPKLREALISIGCDEETARRAWEQIKSQHMGQLDPFTGSRPTVNLRNLEKALNAEAPEPLGEGEVAIVWQHGTLTPENAEVVIHHGG